MFSRKLFLIVALVAAVVLFASFLVSQVQAMPDTEQTGPTALTSTFPDQTNAALQTSGPTSTDCYSVHFHAASDCDRLAGSQVGAQETIRNLYQRFRAADDASWKSWRVYQNNRPIPVTKGPGR